MKTLEEIDAMLCSSVREIAAIAEQMNFVTNFEFVLTDEKLKDKKSDLQYPGIYLIEVKNTNEFAEFEQWVENFRKEYEHEDYKKKSVPNIKLKRLTHHKEMQEWIPVYLGKSKCIGNRFHEHLFLGLNSPTFALKLFARPYFHNHIFRLSTINIGVSSYDQIMPIVETTLRNKINPIIGRQ